MARSLTSRVQLHVWSIPLWLENEIKVDLWQTKEGDDVSLCPSMKVPWCTTYYMWIYTYIPLSLHHLVSYVDMNPWSSQKVSASFLKREVFSKLSTRNFYRSTWHCCLNYQLHQRGESKNGIKKPTVPTYFVRYHLRKNCKKYLKNVLLVANWVRYCVETVPNYQEVSLILGSMLFWSILRVNANIFELE